MEGSKRKKTLYNKTVEKIGADAAEVIPPSSDPESILPADYATQLNNSIYEFLTFEAPGGADSIKDLTQIQYKALCMYLGRKINKPLLLRDYIKGDPRPYNPDVLNALFPAWIYFTACGGFVPFVDDFLTFCGLGVDYIYSGPAKVSQARVEFAQKIKDYQQLALSARLADGRGNPTGILAILNHYHGWTTAEKDQGLDEVRAASVASLPDLSGDIVQIDQ